MRGLLTLLLIVVSTVAFIRGKPTDDKYTTKYDNIDIDQILNSDRLLTNYSNCLLDRGNCAPDAKEVKRLLTDALDSECTKCSEAQQRKGRQVANFLIKNKPALWKELEEKYDPEGNYRKKYEAEYKEFKENP